MCSPGESRSSWVSRLVKQVYTGRGNQQKYYVIVINLKLRFTFDFQNSVKFYAEAPYNGMQKQLLLPPCCRVWSN